MSKPDGLFFIREIAGACGVSINTLRFYEAKGLLQPAYTDPESGYRYYSRQNLHRLRAILRLKSAGLTLPEIKTHLGSNMDIEAKIAKLEERRELLSRTIEDLKLRRTLPGKLTVQEIFLPERLCLCRMIEAKDGEHALTAIAGFYDELIRRRVSLSKTWPEFCEYPDEGLYQGIFKVTDFVITACVPVDKKNALPEAVLYPAGSAVAVNFQGSYYELGQAYEALGQYMISKGYIPSGYPQEIYLKIDGEGSVRLDDANNITRVIIPVKKSNIEAEH